MSALRISALAIALLIALPALGADRILIYYEDGTAQSLELQKPYLRIEVHRETPPPPPEPPVATPAPVGTSEGEDGEDEESFIALGFTEVQRGQSARIEYYSAGPLSPTAWLGIVAAEVPHNDAYENDRYDVVFVYLRGNRYGMLELQIPSNITPGQYEVRIFDSDQNGNEVAASAPFYVQ